MEIWDLYDENRNKINKTHTRGIPMEKNTYHLVVNIFITNEKGELLISQRHPQKTFPLQWEGCGGSVVSREDSYTGALRELKEELGIVPKSMGICVRTYLNNNKSHFNDTWFFHENLSVDDLRLQETEVIDACWVTRGELINMFNEGKMIKHLDYVLEYFYEDFIFCQAKEHHIPYLLDLRERTMNPHMQKAGMPTDKFSNLQRVNYFFEEGRLIYHKGLIVGFLKYSYKEDYIHLIQIQVEPAYQNKGFGKKILQFVLERARAKNLNVRLEVLKNSPARKLYEALGFNIIDEDKFSYEMEKTL